MGKLRVALAIILLTILLGVTVGSFLSPLNMETFNFPAFSTMPRSIFNDHSSGGMQLNMPQLGFSSPFETIIPTSSNSNGAAFNQNLFGGLNGGQKNDFFSSMLSGLQSLPALDLSGSQYIPTPTPTVTPSSNPTATPTPTPTPTPTVTVSPAAVHDSGVIYNQKDNGKTVTVKQGDMFHVKCTSGIGPTNWTMTVSDGLIVADKRFDPNERSIPARQGGLQATPFGTAGMTTWDIIATKPGTQYIHAVEQDVGRLPKDVGSFDLTVNVEAN